MKSFFHNRISDSYTIGERVFNYKNCYDFNTHVFRGVSSSGVGEKECISEGVRPGVSPHLPEREQKCEAW